MVTEFKEFDEHEPFRELAALSSAGMLGPNEWAELKGHLQTCRECSEVHDQYRFLSREGIPLLATDYRYHREERSWDDATAYAKVFRRVRATERQAFFEPALKFLGASRPLRMAYNPQVRAVLVGCLFVVVGLGAYRLGGGNRSVNQLQVPLDNHFQKLAAEKKSLDEKLDAETKKLSRLEQQSSQKEGKLAQARSALRALKDRMNEMNVARTTTSEQLRTVSSERDALSGQLRDAEQAYLKMQADITSLRAERDQALQRTSSLGSRIGELSAVNRDQERRLQKAEEYLSSDRDIRELMGARQLYIADVFDVSSDSRTRKPFGRVFYTQGKSLIFYAFDLDRQPSLQDGSTFQAWGQKESDNKPLNLGILYMDSESNRRWVLRYDDPGELAEIDAVFVTVEPRGGSRKPTGRPYLYALLRKEVNHP